MDIWHLYIYFYVYNKFITMNKIKLIVFFMLFLCFQGFAQKSRFNTATGTEQIKMEKIKGCPELQQQLVTLFGANFKLDDPKVIAKIEKNITDEKASPCIRKNSLYAVYGEKYSEHLNLISTKSNN